MTTRLTTEDEAIAFEGTKELLSREAAELTVIYGAHTVTVTFGS